MNIKLKPWPQDEKDLIISKFLKNAPNYRNTHQGDKAKWLVGYSESAQEGIGRPPYLSSGFASPLCFYATRRNYEVCAVKVIFRAVRI